MNQSEWREFLRQYKEGRITEEEVLLKIKEAPYTDLAYAKLDRRRELQQGVPEVIYGAGKTPQQILGIVKAAEENGQQTVLITRMRQEAADLLQNTIAEKPEEIPGGFTYDPLSHVGIVGAVPAPDGGGKIAVVCAGTSDIPVAEEAAKTAEVLGNEVLRIYDVGVAGIHRLFSRLDDLLSARVVISIAGMEGALTSVVGGLVSVPVIAVPTSVGYGASFHGVSALLSMLNSCASGVSVVNIDNGFGAAYQASMINHLGVHGN